MAYNLKLLKEFSLRSRVLHEVAKICWGDFASNFPYHVEYEEDLVNIESIKLMIHRHHACLRVSVIASTLPKTVVFDLIKTVFYLQRGYMEALVCAEMYRYVDNLVPMNPLWTGPYAAIHFIDPNGCFNELIWAKRIVSEENISVFSRFELACYYCFEEEIMDLWFSVKESGNHPYERSFYDICAKFNYFVALWVYQIDNKFDALIEENDEFADGFYVCGFEYALGKGNEYAARYFWDGFSTMEKATWLDVIVDRDSDDIGNMAYRECAGCVNFIYSILSVEQKRDILLNPDLDYNLDFFVFFCLLASPYYKSALNDLLTLSVPVSGNTLRLLLEKLASRLKMLPIPEYKETFRALWQSLSLRKRIEFLELNSNIIFNLAAIRATGLLKLIIQPLPPAKKKWMLLFDWQLAGITALDLYSQARDYNELRHYLLFFLVNIDPITRKRTVRDDAFELLDEFCHGDMFTRLINGRIPKYEKAGILAVMDNLQGSLQVLNSVLHQVETLHIGELRLTGKRKTKFLFRPSKKKAGKITKTGMISYC